MGSESKALMSNKKDKFEELQEHHVNKKAMIGDASKNQGTPKILTNHQELGERAGTDHPSGASKGTNSVNTLISNF